MILVQDFDSAVGLVIWLKFLMWLYVFVFQAKRSFSGGAEGLDEAQVSLHFAF